MSILKKTRSPHEELQCLLEPIELNQQDHNNLRGLIPLGRFFIANIEPILEYYFFFYTYVHYSEKKLFIQTILRNVSFKIIIHFNYKYDAIFLYVIES